MSKESQYNSSENIMDKIRMRAEAKQKFSNPVEKRLKWELELHKFKTRAIDRRERYLKCKLMED